MAQTIQDPSVQNVQASNSGGAQTFGQQPVQSNTQGNQGISFNQQTSSGGQGSQTPSTPKPQGTGFTNVNNILNANQGNKLGQTIQTGIQNTAQGFQNNLSSAQNQFNTGVQANTFGANDQTNVNNTINSASNLQAGQTVDPTQLSQFQNYTAGGFQGPTTLQNADFLQGQAQQAEQLGQQVGTAGGQQNLLQRFVGNSQYGQGQKTLDQLLLGQQQGNLNQAQASTFGLTNQALGATNNAQQVANQAVSANQLFGKNAAASATAAQNPINTAINNSITTDIQNQNQQQYQYNQLQKLLGESATDYNTQVNALGANGANPSVQSSGNPAVDQINAVLSGLSGLGVDNATLQQLAGPVLEKNINNIPGYLSQILGATSLNNTNGLTVSNPDTTNYGTLGYQVNPNDVSSLANQNAVMNKSQAAQLNALQQLAGGTGNINASGVGTYNPNTVSFDLNKLTPDSQYGNGTTVTPTPNVGSLQALGNTLAGISEGVGGVASPVAGSLAGNIVNQDFNTLGDLSKGNIGAAVSNQALQPITVGNQLVNQVNQNPLSVMPVVGSLLGDKIGNPLSGITSPVIGVAQNLVSQITNPISQVFGGGGGKIICNELYRQGYISDKIIKLDEEFGKKYRKLNPDAYRGYLLIATPIVALMKRSPLFTKAISKISLPWASFMANKMDDSIPGSKLGMIIHNIGMFIFPKIYRINKFIKRVNSEYSRV